MFFTAVQYIDTYYAKIGKQMQKKDLQLTAVTAILMASKLLETVSLKLSFCMDTLGHKKYSQE